MVNHTPGPWRAGSLPTCATGFIWSKDGTQIAAEIDKISDARLIAAAPDLLDALQSAAGHLQETLDDPRWREMHPVGICPVLDKVRAAIAKATGEDQ